MGASGTIKKHPHPTVVRSGVPDMQATGRPADVPLPGARTIPRLKRPGPPRSASHTGPDEGTGSTTGANVAVLRSDRRSGPARPDLDRVAGDVRADRAGQHRAGPRAGPHHEPRAHAGSSLPQSVPTIDGRHLS